MPQKNQNQKSSTRLTTGGFANMIVLIIFLLTMGGAVVYFKNFPLEKLPAGEPHLTSTDGTEMGISAAQKLELEKCQIMETNAINELKQFTEHVNAREPGISQTERENFALEGMDIEIKVKEARAKCKIMKEPFEAQLSPEQKEERRLKRTRDAARIGHIKQLQSALSMYRYECKGYPVVNPSAAVDVALAIPSCKEGKSFISYYYQKSLPTNPLPGGTTYQYCSADKAGNCTTPPVGEKAESYKITFTLEAEGDTTIIPISAGPHTATPEHGIN